MTKKTVGLKKLKTILALLILFAVPFVGTLQSQTGTASADSCGDRPEKWVFVNSTTITSQCAIDRHDGSVYTLESSIKATSSSGKIQKGHTYFVFYQYSSSADASKFDHPEKCIDQGNGKVPDECNSVVIDGSSPSKGYTSGASNGHYGSDTGAADVVFTNPKTFNATTAAAAVAGGKVVPPTALNPGTTTTVCSGGQVVSDSTGKCQDCPDGQSKDANGTCQDNDNKSSEASAVTGCDASGNPLSWAICPIVTGAQEAIKVIDGWITSALTFDTNTVFHKQGGYYVAWNSFRVIATAIIVIAGLVMVVSQALGLEILDAYTIRKVLPRLLIAIIGISLSWPLMEFVITFFNTLGVDIRELIYSPFSSLKGTLGGSTLLTGNLALLAGGLALGIFGFLSLALTGFLAILVGFAIIVVRDLGLEVLIIFAPIAIAGFILPNTQRIWKLWSENFFGLLMLYPIISAFIAIGRVFSAVSLQPGGANANGAGTITQVIGFAAYFAPYFLLPLTFRIATGFIGNLAGFMNDRSRGVFDRLKKGRQERTADRFSRAQNQSLWDNNNKVGKFANRAASWATDPLNNAAYHGRGVPGLKKRGQKVAGQLEHAAMDQSTKLFEELNKMGYNDKAYRALSGSHGDLSGLTQGKLQDAGLLNKAPQSLGDLQKISQILGESDKETEQLAGNAIHGSMGRLATLYQDPEMGKANMQAAGIMGLAAHGFASGDDLAIAGNGLQKTNGRGFANSVLSQATVVGARSRPDIKAGYGFVYQDGKFVSGMKAGRGKQALETLSADDLAGAKGGAIQAFKPEIKAALDAGGPKAQAVIDQMRQWVGPYSRASVDVKARTIAMMEEFGIPQEPSRPLTPGELNEQQAADAAAARAAAEEEARKNGS